MKPLGSLNFDTYIVCVQMIFSLFDVVKTGLYDCVKHALSTGFTLCCLDNIILLKQIFKEEAQFT